MPLDLNDPFRFSFNPGDDSYAVSGFEPETVTDFTRGRYRFNGAWGVFSDLTFARASTATYVDSTGTLQTASSGMARLGHHKWDGSKWVNKGLLLESEARTNLWDTTLISTALEGATVASSSLTHLGAYSDVVEVTETTSTGVHGLSHSIVGANSSVNNAASVVVKATGSSTWVRLRLNEVAAGGNFIDAFYNLSGAGSVGTTLVGGVGVIAGTTIESLGNGEYRIGLAGVIGASAANSVVFRVYGASGNGQYSYAGNVGRSWIVGGVQVEAGSAPSSYIPTSGATATRAAETLAIPAALVPATAAVSFHLDGEINFVDADAFSTVVPYSRFADGNNFIASRVNCGGVRTGELNIQQSTAGVAAVVAVTSQNYYTPGVNVPLNFAARHVGGAFNGAADGVPATENTTLATLPDLSGVNLQLGVNFMGTISTFRQWAADLGDTGIAEASA